jgi:hypothetical protein
MALTKAQFDRLHSCQVLPVNDATSRFSFVVKCSCGIQGFFFTKEQAEVYKEFHLSRAAMAPF